MEALREESSDAPILPRSVTWVASGGRRRSFGPADRVPERCVETPSPGFERADGPIHVLPAHEAALDDRVARAFEDAGQVGDQRLEVGMTGAASEEEEGVPTWERACLSNQGDQAPADEGVVAGGAVGLDVGPPGVHDVRGLRPEPEQVVVVVGEDDPSARPQRPHHGADHDERIRNVLEEETGMRDVEGPPLRGGQGEGCRVPVPPLDQRALAGLLRLAPGLGELGRIPLDPEDPSLWADIACHGAGELAEAAPYVQDALSASERDLSEGGTVDQGVQP